MRLQDEVQNLSTQLERSTTSRIEAEAYRQREVKSLKSECHGLTKALAESQDVVKELEMELDVMYGSFTVRERPGGDPGVPRSESQLSSAQAALEGSHPVPSVAQEVVPHHVPGSTGWSRGPLDTLVYGVEIPTPPVPFSPPPRSNLAEVSQLRGYPTPASQGHQGVRWLVATVETLLPIGEEAEALEGVIIPDLIMEAAHDDYRDTEDKGEVPLATHPEVATMGADLRTFADAPKLHCADRGIPLEHFLNKFNALKGKYDITDAQVVRIFDDRLTLCGVRSCCDFCP
ncbi:hypothetical protein H310_03166 [Aphanomyces invadans]|uniref:Uncharacterized protein n=1 Tax=Aphanomyces invadans TaxID=157072 RepID=A0A024UKW6_9STRA|nr:hypothetical protein H310_03166 [Aphanomyces invadans]ETW07096.1 hypothetical protein H310_03166 [Aphanomyces invadans]|eukprot:XP_008865171.1 hypothetical protein H310_03166 [Aphanomyces invadans]